MEGGDGCESRAALRRAIVRLWRAQGRDGGARGAGAGSRSGGAWAFRLLCFCLGLFVHRAALSGQEKLQVNNIYNISMLDKK